MKNLKSLVSLSLLALMFSPSTHATTLSNFNEPNSQKLIGAIQTKRLNVVQLGDSHTAADEMSNALRLQLQSKLGNGGMGWGMPMYITGHRLVRYGYDNNNWQAVSSRSQRDENYSLGGLLAIPKFAGASLTIKPKLYEAPQKIKVSIRQVAGDGALVGTDAQGRSISIEAPVKNGTWQIAEFNAQLPFSLRAQQVNNTALGGWWAENENGSGAVVSALGINGAQLSIWERWNRQGWQTELSAVSPDLLILAYGTNEAYNDNLDIDQARRVLVSQIQGIRKASPNSAIMIASAPESLKNIAGSCGTRPVKLTAMQQMQREVAQQQHTLFWDWQQAMGGSCSMKSWINQGDARRDGVHFSASGYLKLGNQMAQDILALSGQSMSNQDFGTPAKNPLNFGSSSSSYSQNKSVATAKPSVESSPYTTTTTTYTLGTATMCLQGQKECKTYQK